MASEMRCGSTRRRSSKSSEISRRANGANLVHPFAGEHHEPFRLQLAEGFAHRGAADAELRGDLLLLQLHPLRVLAGEDAAMQLLCHLD